MTRVAAISEMKAVFVRGGQRDIALYERIALAERMTDEEFAAYHSRVQDRFARIASPA